MEAGADFFQEQCQDDDVDQGNDYLLEQVHVCLLVPWDGFGFVHVCDHVCVCAQCVLVCTCVGVYARARARLTTPATRPFSILLIW